MLVWRHYSTRSFGTIYSLTDFFVGYIVLAVGRGAGARRSIIMASDFLSERRQMAFRRGEEQGFSLLEITIVVAILMVTIAFAFPEVLNYVLSLAHDVSSRYSK